MNRHQRRANDSLGKKLHIDYLHDSTGHRLMNFVCSNPSCRHMHNIRLKCQDRFCESCRYREWIRLYKKYLPIVKSAKYLTFLTLTIKNYAFLTPDRVRECNIWLRQFFNHPQIRGRFRGALSCQEIIHKSDDKGWNGHVHCLVDGDFVDIHEISRIWRSITGDSSVCFIVKCHGPEHYLHYLLKYMKKAPCVSGADSYSLRHDYNRSFHGLRAVNSHGSFYDAELLIPDDDDFICLKCGSPMQLDYDLSFFYEFAPDVGG